MCDRSPCISGRWGWFPSGMTVICLGISDAKVSLNVYLSRSEGDIVHSRFFTPLLIVMTITACGGGGGNGSSTPTPQASTPATPVITAPTTMVKGQSYQATTPAQTGSTFTWGITGGTVKAGQTTPSITFTADVTGSLVLTCKAQNSGGSSATAQVSIKVADPAPASWGLFRHLKGSTPAALMVGASASTSGTLTMSSKRVYHTATQIPDGRIVIIGGSGAAGEVFPQTIDLFDPLTERFTVAATKLPVPRISHQAVLMNDGRIALIGGGGSDNIDIYDPIADTLTENVMVFEHERREFTALAVGNGKILIFGGYNNDTGQPMQSPKMIDTLTWTQKILSTDPNLNRRSFGFTKLKNGKVVFSGGVGGAYVVTNTSPQDVIVFDPTTETFQTVGAMQEPRRGHTMLELPDGTLGIYGGGVGWTTGASTETFDISTSVSAYGGDLIGNKSFMLSACLQNGFTLHCGGRTGNLITNTQMVYDPVSKLSGYTNSMLTARKDFTLTVMPNGFYLVTGGQDDAGNPLDGAEVFDPQASVTVTYPSAVLPYTESVQMTASGDTTGLVWTCDAGTIDQTGRYTAPGLTSNEAMAYITATNANGRSAVVRVAFTRDVFYIDGPAKVAKDSTANIYAAVINWYKDKTVTWSTDKGKIDASGMLDVTGLPLGEIAKITATLNANMHYASSRSVLVQ